MMRSLEEIVHLNNNPDAHRATANPEPKQSTFAKEAWERDAKDAMERRLKFNGRTAKD